MSTSASNCPQVGWKSLAYYWLKTRCFNSTINAVCGALNSPNFWFRLLWKKVFILRDATAITQVLSTRDVDLTYIQRNFNLIHNHTQTINGCNSSDPLWLQMHSSLKNSLLSFSELKTIMHKHLPVLYDLPQLTFDVSERLEEYLVRVWSEFSYGSNADYHKYKQCRQKINALLKNDFHDSRLVKLPIIGAIYCRYMYWRHSHQWAAINQMIDELISLGTEGFVSRFAETMKASSSINFSERHRYVRDNAFLLFLVVDFIHKVLLDYLLRYSLVRSNCTTTDLDGNPVAIDCSQIFQQSLSNGFLYPYRYRWVQKSVPIRSGSGSDSVINPGDLVIFDLKSSHLYFSSGPRSCIGQGLVRRVFFDFFTEEILKHQYLRLNRTDLSYVEGSYDVPLLQGQYIGQWLVVPRTSDDLMKAVKCYDHSGLKYYNILNFYGDPAIFNYLVSDIIGRVSKISLDCIVGVEMRGLSFAGALAYILHVPLYFVRKCGKLPGEVYIETYSKATSQVPDQLELSKDDPLMGKRVLIVDDGVASGGTSLATIRLVEKAGGQVVKFVTMVDHTYRERTADYVKYQPITYSCVAINS